MAGSGSSRWEEPHTDAVPEEAAGLDRAAHSTAGAGGGKAVDVMTRSDAGLSSGAKRVIREEASSILRALGEGGQRAPESGLTLVQWKASRRATVGRI